MKLIGLTGRKFAGKDTFADYLTKQYNFTKLGFADPLASAATTMFKWQVETMREPAYKDIIDAYLGISRRDVMKFLGHEGRKHLGEDVWILVLARVLDRLHHSFGKTNFVINDIRYDNEANWIRNQGGKIIFINADQRLGPQTDNTDGEAGITIMPADLSIQNNNDVLSYTNDITRLTPFFL